MVECVVVVDGNACDDDALTRTKKTNCNSFLFFGEKNSEYYKIESTLLTFFCCCRCVVVQMEQLIEGLA